MKLLQGIQVHEIILMILGFILGLSLVFVFIYTALKNRLNLLLIYFFIAPVVMIGYPSIRSIEFGKDVVKIERLVEQVNNDPLDTDAQKELINNLKQLPASRCKTSSEAMLAIAHAQTALGQYDSAFVTINRAVELDPNSVRARESHRAIEEKKETQKRFEKRIRQLEDVIKKLEKQPADTKLRDTIAQNLRQLDAPVHLENHQIILVAKALAIMDNKLEAVAITDNVLKMNPRDKEAAALRSDIKR